jgi:subtilase family serine protease
MMHRLLFAVSKIMASIMIVVISVFSFGQMVLAAHISRKVCASNPPAGWARCHASFETVDGMTPMASSGPVGYSPAMFRAAYGIQNKSVTRVAVVGAYDAPTIQSDVATFSRTFGLPSLPACTSAGQLSCLEKLNQQGGKQYPSASPSWALEMSMDVESVHGMCPGCRITLVEASSPSMLNLTAAVDTAVATGAKVVSNSYGGPESSGESQYDGHYHHPGVAVVVSSGDDGYGTSYPAAVPWVVAVGGTHLHLNTTGTQVISETAWGGAGSGCSQFEAKPSWQTDAVCTRRSIADIAADADPASGAAIYDSYADNGHSGWFTVGGTSLAAPLVAGMIASSGSSGNQPAYLYTHKGSNVRDIVSGHNGTCAKAISYLCKTTVGYDGPTGLGVLSNL